MGMKKGGKHFGEIIILDVLEMKRQGKTNKEIAQYYGFDNVKVIKNLINRHNRNMRNIALNIPAKPKGRPRKNLPNTLQKLEIENKRLKMENELLRDFLCETERG